MKTALRVRVTRDGDRPEAGVVYLPGRADHLVLTAHGTLGYRSEPVDNPYRPSVDVFFESVARHWRAPVAGVVLSGMGADGARGLKLLRERGHPTIAQDRASSAVFGMPKAAIECGAAAQVLPVGAIGAALRRLLPNFP
jgi:two-component system response regulator WspF